jgi:hypothetical protein
MKSTRLSLRQLARTGAIMTLIGAEDPEGPKPEGEPGGNNSGGAQAGGDGGAGNQPTNSDQSGGDPQKKIVALTEEKDRHFAARTEAERQRDELQTRVDEIERKDKSDLENAQTDLKKAQETITAKDETIRRLTVQNAFYAHADVVWHDPADALRLVDLSEVKIDEKTGEVTNPETLKAAIKKLADDKAYLVKTDDSKSGGSSKDGKKPPATGKPPADKTQDEKAAQDAQLRNKYPALRAH